MANTTTSRYGFTKPEIGAATDTWGNLLNSNWDDADSQLLRKLDKTLVDAVSQTITIANTNSRVTTTTTKGFQNVGVGDRIFISGSDASSGANNGIHTVTAIDTTNWLYVDCSGSTFVDDGAQTMTWGVVTKMKIDSSPGIDNTPMGANTASSGAFTTISASGTTTLNGNTTLGNANTDTVTSNAKHGATTFTGQITSEVADGTAPMVVTSTTKVANLNADSLDGQTAPSGTIVGTSDTQELTNKTLNSSTNTIHADQWRTSRTLTLSGDCTGSATMDGSGNVTLTTTVGGIVKFKQTIQSTTLPTSATASASGKILVAFGYLTVSEGSNITTTVDPAASGRYGYAYSRGYGYGDCVATRTYGGSWDSGGNPSGTINWQYCVEMDVAS